MLKVNEIFYSLQGESTFAGKPCIFIRLSGCNLSCSYCDTRYALDEGYEMEVGEILAKVESYPCELVEITGGEPLCQPESIKLMDKLLAQNYNVLLETNGSIDLADVPDEVIKIVDVKLPGSGCWGSFFRDNLDFLECWDELKFVISSREDYVAAVGFLDEHDLWEHEVLFSPVTDRLAPSLLAEWILKDALQVRLQLQLHKLLDIK